MENTNEQKYKELQKQEINLWKIIDDGLTDKQVEAINELIDINIQMEEYCNL